MSNPTSETTIASQPAGLETGPDFDRISAKDLRRILAFSNRVRVLPGGARVFVRFSQVVILEHWILLSTFTVLALTGLLEVYIQNKTAAQLVAFIFQNIDNVRAVHNQAAILFAGLAVIHGYQLLTTWIVRREPGLMMPSGRDLRDLVHLLKYDFGRIEKRPLYGRFTIEEKITYWAVVVFSVVMLITGLIQWQQGLVTAYLPEAVMPVTRVVHTMTGLLALVTLLPWHLYHTVVRVRNTSIFTGLMDEHMIRREHPLEYQEVMRAYQQLRAYFPGQAVIETTPTPSPAEEQIPEEAPVEGLVAPSDSAQDREDDVMVEGKDRVVGITEGSS